MKHNYTIPPTAKALVLVMMVMIFGLKPGWGQEAVIYSTGFEAAENFTAGTTYNNTTIKYDGPSEQQWGTYYGTASTTDPITGGQSMQMRYYTASPSNLGYTFMNFDLPNVTKVTFKALNTSGNNVYVSYSTDEGLNYTGSQLFTLGTSASSFTYNISESGEYEKIRIRFLLSPGSINSSRITIDDIQIYGITTAASTPAFTPPAGDYLTPQNVEIQTSTPDATIYYTLDGTDPNDLSTEYTGAINISSTTTLKAIAYAVGMDPSNIASALYTFIDEPVNQATAFSASANSSSAITVTWTDAVPAAGGYLIKGSIEDFNNIDSPVDGTPEDDGSLVKNVTSGIQSHQFIGLNADTEYFFKIFAYNGSGIATNYLTTDAPEISAVTNARPSGYFVDFEGTDETKWSYASGTVNLSGLDWDMTNILIGTSAADWKYEARSARLNATGTSAMTMLESKASGAGTVSFFYRRYGTDNQANWKVEYSTDEGVNWIQVGAVFTAPASDEVMQFSEAIEIPGNIRIRIKQADETGTANRRLNIDNIHITDYVVSTWTGAESTDWHSGANWSEGVPAANANIFIPGGLAIYPTLSSAIQVNNLTLESGATILDNSYLTINGSFSMKRTIPFGGWQMIASPVSGMDILGSDFAPADTPLPTNFDFYSFDEANSALPWINLRAESAAVNTSFETTFTKGKGYLVAYLTGSFAANPFSFTGNLNTGDVQIPLAYTEASEWKGWNLIGNPYPSGINWGAVSKGALADNFAQIYDRDTQEYVPQEGGTIAANQGFFVKVDAVGALTLTNNDRVHGGSYTKSNDITESLVLQLANEQYHTTTVLRVVEGSGFERDRRDALKLFSFNQEKPQLFSLTSDNIYVAVNSIPVITEEAVIPLGMKIPATGSYQISVQEASGAFEGRELFLFDLATGKETLISGDGQYEFDANATGDEPLVSRFELRFKSIGETTDIATPSKEKKAVIYAYDNTLYLSFGEAAPGRQFEVFDLSGRILMHQTLSDAIQHSHPLKLQTGIYLVRITGKNFTQTDRIYIK